MLKKHPLSKTAEETTATTNIDFPLFRIPDPSLFVVN